MRAVLDANIAAALMIRLPYSAAAEEAVREASEILAPDLIFSETANAFWKMARLDMALLFHGKAALQKLNNLFDLILPSQESAVDAYMMAVEHGHPVYDCIYVIAARKSAATLITADKRLAALAAKTETAIRLVSA
ncbi:MAG: type II toxin-antitoxin system VapC family toxin [Proteobacteria bacterium]|nr:type II toxin-antitoxin system VapC family toxin [Pseudomonadota bacterium]